MSKPKQPIAITLDGIEYDTLMTYKDKHGSYWQSAGRRDSDDMPIMETSEYYGGEQHDGMSVRRLDELVAECGPIEDADPDLADQDDDTARALRSYRNSIRLMPSTPSAGRWSMMCGRLQQSVELLGKRLDLQVDEPYDEARE